MVNTLVHVYPIHKGSQWAVFVASDVSDPLQTLVDVNFMHKGVMVQPLGTYSIQLST